MRTFLTLTTIAVIGFVGAADAVAKVQDETAPLVVPVDQMKARMSMLGYDIWRLEKDDNAYEVVLVDRDGGGKVKAYFDSRTGELIRAKLAHDRNDDDEPNEVDARGKPKLGRK